MLSHLPPEEGEIVGQMREMLGSVGAAFTWHDEALEDHTWALDDQEFWLLCRKYRPILSLFTG